MSWKEIRGNAFSSFQNAQVTFLLFGEKVKKFWLRQLQSKQMYMPRYHWLITQYE
jgi:hypothetical protein